MPCFSLYLYRLWQHSKVCYSKSNVFCSRAFLQSLEPSVIRALDQVLTYATLHKICSWQVLAALCCPKPHCYSKPSTLNKKVISLLFVDACAQSDKKFSRCSHKYRATLHDFTFAKVVINKAFKPHSPTCYVSKCISNDSNTILIIFYSNYYILQ